MLRFPPRIVFAIAFGFIFPPAMAGDMTDNRSPDFTAVENPAPTAAVRTGKERLGAKWTDEQRVDDCGIPAARRGASTRPAGCSHKSGNSAASTGMRGPDGSPN